MQRYSDVNITGTAVLLDVIGQVGQKVQHVILSSSRAVYGEGAYMDARGNKVYPRTRDLKKIKQGSFEFHSNDGLELQAIATDEEALPNPTSVYGVTKHAQEQLLECLSRAAKVPFTTFRFQNVYGPGQSLKNPYTGIIAIFAGLALAHQAIQIFEDGQQTRDFVYIDDIVKALVSVPLQTGSYGQIFNVGCGIKTSVIEVAQSIVNAVGSKSTIEINGKHRVGDIRHNYASMEKIRQLLGFEPRVSFRQGLQKTIEWIVESNESAISGYKRSVEELEKRGLFQ
jgi:dTDP-L-rhamnose 4-epimerase